MGAGTGLQCWGGKHKEWPHTGECHSPPLPVVHQSPRDEGGLAGHLMAAPAGRAQSGRLSSVLRPGPRLPPSSPLPARLQGGGEGRGERGGDGGV